MGQDIISRIYCNMSKKQQKRWVKYNREVVAGKRETMSLDFMLEVQRDEDLDPKDRPGLEPVARPPAPTIDTIESEVLDLQKDIDRMLRKYRNHSALKIRAALRNLIK